MSLSHLYFDQAMVNDLSFRQYIELLKGNDNKQWIIEGKAYRDEEYEGPDELDNEDYIRVMRDYWKVYPKEFSWEKFDTSDAYRNLWEEWLITRAANYMYVEWKFKDKAQQGMCKGWGGIKDLIIE